MAGSALDGTSAPSVAPCSRGRAGPPDPPVGPELLVLWDVIDSRVDHRTGRLLFLCEHGNPARNGRSSRQWRTPSSSRPGSRAGELGLGEVSRLPTVTVWAARAAWTSSTSRAPSLGACRLPALPAACGRRRPAPSASGSSTAAPDGWSRRGPRTHLSTRHSPLMSPTSVRWPRASPSWVVSGPRAGRAACRAHVRRRTPARSAATVSAAMWSSACAGSEITDALALD